MSDYAARGQTCIKDGPFLSFSLHIITQDSSIGQPRNLPSPQQQLESGRSFVLFLLLLFFSDLVIADRIVLGLWC